MEETVKQQTPASVGDTYEHTSKKGNTFLVTPVMKLANVPQFPQEFLGKPLQVRDDTIVFMKPKPLTEEEKAKRRAERKHKTQEMLSIKESIKTDLKNKKAAWFEERDMADKEGREFNKALREAYLEAMDKWEAVKGTRTLSQTKEALGEF